MPKGPGGATAGGGPTAPAGATWGPPGGATTGQKAEGQHVFTYGEGIIRTL